MAHVGAAIAAAGTTAPSEQINMRGSANGNDTTGMAAAAAAKRLEAENVDLAARLVRKQTQVNAIASVIGWGVEIKFALACYLIAREVYNGKYTSLPEARQKNVQLRARFLTDKDLIEKLISGHSPVSFISFRIMVDAMPVMVCQSPMKGGTAADPVDVRLSLV